MRGQARRHVVVGGAIILATSLGLSHAVGEVVARCGDSTILRTEVEAVVQRLGLAELPDGPQRARAEAAVLEQLVDERILRIELDRLGIQVTAADVDVAVRRLEEQVAGRGGDFEAFLISRGRTATTIRDQVALEIGLDKFVRQQITPEALAAAFERNRREFDGTRLRVSHIVLRPEAGGDGDPATPLLARAKEIRQRIIQGRISFSDAARAHSAGPSRRGGGDLGWIGREGPMADAFAAQAYRVAKGSVSEPFVTPYGVHLLTVTDVEAGRIGFDAVRSKLEKLLATELVRGLVVAGRQRTPVSFSAGVPHLDPATLGRPADDRPVIDGGPPAG
ncbi:MAG: peptidylprolyl isomerase [Planctomycetota bacterium]